MFFKERGFKLNKLKLLIFVTLLATANVTLFIFGVAKTTASISQTLYAAVPLLSAIITFILYKDRVGREKEIGLIVGFVGVLVIILLPLIGKASPISGTLTGNLLIFLAVVSVSFYFVLSKNFHKQHSPLALTSIFVVLTVLVQSILLPIDRSNLISLTHINPASLFAVFYCGILGTGVYYLVYQHAIKKASPIEASLTFYLQPIFGIIWAVILLGEKITPTFIAGGLLVLIGVFIVTKNKTVVAIEP